MAKLRVYVQKLLFFRVYGSHLKFLRGLASFVNVLFGINIHCFSFAGFNNYYFRMLLRKFKNSLPLF